jgi:hypothetical protein
VLLLITIDPETTYPTIEMPLATLTISKTYAQWSLTTDVGTDFCPSRHYLYTNFSIVIDFCTLNSEVAPHRK